MNISITGTGPRNTAKLDKAARFFANQLLHARTAQKLVIDIDVVRTLDVDGECISEDDHKDPRNFTIHLKRAPIEDMIKVLSHEMVHVKQYAKNELGKELSLARGGKGLKVVTRWHGEYWFPKGKEDEYWDCPWEVQAYGMEVGLYHKWFHRKDPKAKWYVGEDA